MGFSVYFPTNLTLFHEEKKIHLFIQHVSKWLQTAAGRGSESIFLEFPAILGAGPQPS